MSSDVPHRTDSKLDVEEGAVDKKGKHKKPKPDPTIRPRRALAPVLRAILLDFRVRHSLFTATCAGLVLGCIFFTDNWYQLPTGSLQSPSGITMYGRWGRREYGRQVLTTYSDEQAAVCDAAAFDIFFKESNLTKGVQRQLQRLQNKKQCTFERHPPVVLLDIQNVICPFRTVLATTGKEFALCLWMCLALWAAGLALVLATFTAKSMTLPAAGLCFLSFCLLLEFSLWRHRYKMKNAVSEAWRNLDKLDECSLPADMSALGQTLKYLLAPEMHAAFSFYAAHIAVFFAFVSFSIALSSELRLICAPARKVFGVCGACFFKSVGKPFVKCIETKVVGVSDFDHKFEGYKNKHAGMGRPVNCCAGTPIINNSLTFLRDISRHQKRAFESMGFMHSLVSDSEKCSLERHGVMDQMAQNFLAWRLSVLVLAASFGMLILILRPLNIIIMSQDAGYVLETAYSNKWEDLDKVSFRNASKAMMTKVSAMATKEVEEAEMWMELAHYMAEAFAVFMCLLALSCWIYFGSSKKYLVRGWIILLFAPFVITLIPMRSLVDLRAARVVMDEYVQTVIKTLHLEDKIDKCTNWNEKGSKSADQNMASLEKSCKTLDNWDDSWSVWMSGVDVTKMTAACTQFNEAKSKGKIDDYKSAIEKTCKKLNTALGYGKDFDKRAWVRDLVARANVLMEMYVAARCALSAYKMMVPAALAFGPGFVRASWKLKLLFPLARLPGVAVVVLPAMYCPLLWMTYQFLFQILGHPVLLLGLVLISFAPMIYTIVGITFDIQSPVLSRSRLARILRHGRFWRIWIQRFGVITICIWALLIEFGVDDFMSDPNDTMRERQYKASLWSQMRAKQSRWWSQPLQIGLFIFSWAFKFFYTKAAGMDFLIQSLASDYAFESIAEVVAKITDDQLAQADQIVADNVEGIGVPEKVEETRQLTADRKRIGNALVKMTMDEITTGGMKGKKERDEQFAQRIFEEFAPDLVQCAQVQGVQQSNNFQAWATPYTNYDYTAYSADTSATQGYYSDPYSRASYQSQVRSSNPPPMGQAMLSPFPPNAQGMNSFNDGRGGQPPYSHSMSQHQESWQRDPSMQQTRSHQRIDEAPDSWGGAVSPLRAPPSWGRQPSLRGSSSNSSQTNVQMISLVPNSRTGFSTTQSNNPQAQSSFSAGATGLQYGPGQQPVQIPYSGAAFSPGQSPVQTPYSGANFGAPPHDPNQAYR